MNLANSTEPMGEQNCGAHYKIDTPHDMLYYPVSIKYLNIIKNVYFYFEFIILQQLFTCFRTTLLK